MASGPLLNDDLASSDLSYLSDIEEEAGSNGNSAASSRSGSSSALNASELDSNYEASSLLSDSGSCTLDWRSEMTPGTVSIPLQNREKRFRY